MPAYLYSTEDDMVHELVMSVAEMEARQDENGYINLDDGTLAKRRIDLEHGNFVNTSGNWPMHSSAASVHPAQIAKAREVDRQMGVPTEYDGKGRPRFESATHRRKYLRAHRMFDKDGFD